MRTRSPHGGRHELGQNFLTHRPTVHRIVDLVARTDGDIIEIGAGDGALTVPLAALGRSVTAVEIDDRRARRLRERCRGVTIVVADALRYPLDAPVVVGNIPYHLTTPLLRRLLSESRWRRAILLTQWEVARKRAGVGGGTMMTAQAAPWFEFDLHGRVPARHFSPMPSVDSGILSITRRAAPLLPLDARREYERFVRAVFTSRGSGLASILRSVTQADRRIVARLLASERIGERSLPRDLSPQQWAALWRALAPRAGGAR